MSEHPYRALPDHAFWSRSVARPAQAEVDPVIEGRFKIARTDKIATAGSCFAQHIARHLAQAGFAYLVTETVNPIIEDASGFNYGTYTARYGNIYTARQLFQLLQRAYGMFRPAERIWLAENGRCKDPFRPEIQPDGFASAAEFEADQAQHFAAVRQMVKDLDVFVFTLGLTEAWLSREDGAVFPLCPGVAGGAFDPARHAFVNFGVQEIVDDVTRAFDLIREQNPRARFILTVSPVPLAATAEPRSVLVSTTVSKAVLRVAADLIQAAHHNVAYFPSYEIVTGPHARGRYFAPDLRSVTPEGVEHVMRLFMRHYAGAAASAPVPQPRAGIEGPSYDAIREAADVICEEAMLDQAMSAASLA